MLLGLKPVAFSAMRQAALALIASYALIANPLAGFAETVNSNVDLLRHVVYMEVKPSAVGKAEDFVKSQLNALRERQPDNEYVLLQELGRPNQFVVLAGTGNKGHDANTRGLSTAKINMQSFQILPNFLLDSTPLAGSKKLYIPLNSFVMVAHLDADPSQRDKTLPQLQELLKVLPGLSGNNGAQVLTWNLRSNHWTLIEAWNSRNSFNQSIENSNVRQIRAAIASHAAAPSDLRLYTRID